MDGDSDVNYSLILAVRHGKLERARELINIYGLSYSSSWSNGYVLLREALKNKHLAVAKLLVSSGSKVNSHQSKWIPSETPLHSAAKIGDSELVHMLLRRGAAVNAKNVNGETPLYNGIINRRIDVSELLLNYGADVNLRMNNSTSGDAPLHFAVRSGSTEITTLLLNRGAHVNMEGGYNWTPLHIAVIEEHETIVKLLLLHGANFDSEDRDGNSTLYLAVKNGFFKIVEALLGNNPDINSESNRRSLKAAVDRYGRNYNNIVDALLDYGFSVSLEDVNDSQLLHKAVEKGYFRYVKELLKLGVDINIRDIPGNTPIFYAIRNADFKTSELLLTNGANVKNDPELLNTAVMTECLKITEDVLKYGADIHATDLYGRTALHFTALNGDEGCLPYFGFSHLNRWSKHPNIIASAEIAGLLLSQGAGVDAQTIYGLTTLHAAALKGYTNVIKTLLNCNANVNCRESLDMTPLHFAAKNENEKVCTILLKSGADVNAKKNAGTTALHIAVEMKHMEVVKVLLAFGADINLEDDNGITPLHLALNRRFLFQCEEETARIKSTMINNSNVSYFHIFAKPTSSLDVCMRNEDVVQTLISGNYKTTFPIYANMIETYFKKALKRKRLLEHGNQMLYSLITNYCKLGLPHVCTEKILSYSSNKDMNNLIDACEFLNHESN